MVNKMKILLIASAIGKSPEVVSYSFVFEEAYRLAKRGFEIHVVRRSFTDEDGEASFNLYFYGLGSRKFNMKAVRMLLRNLTEYPIYSFLRNPKAFYLESLYAWRALSVAGKIRPDLIHAHFAYPEGFVGYLVKKALNIPLVITVHGYDVLTEPSIGYGIRLKKSYNALVEKTLNSADAIICNSKALYDEVVKIVKDRSKIYLIYNATDLKRFTLIDRDEARTKLGLPKDKFIVFTVRIHEPKYGVEYLIRAVPLVVSKAKNVLFIVGGEGSLRKYHENLAKMLGVSDYVAFTGRIPQSLLPLYYAASDVVVVPSLQEAWGLVATEALASGKPVIASNVGGLREQVIDGFNGFLVPPRDPKAIAEKILYFLENPSEIERMGLNGRKLAEEKFDIEKRVDKIIELYNSVLKNTYS